VTGLPDLVSASIVVIAAVPFAGCAGPCSSFGSDDDLETTTEVSDVIGAQQEAWNRGDLAAFMEVGYWHAPDLTFYSGGQVSHGFDEMLAHYRASYEGPGKELGRLEFRAIEVVPLEDDLALARGRWDLDYAEKPDVGGLFTLLFRRFDVGWRIVHDHTSVDG
jgi:uncharacterized protein (TIGR02246 family)